MTLISTTGPRVAIALTASHFARTAICQFLIHPYLDREPPAGCSAFISMWPNTVPHLHHGVKHLSKLNEKKLEWPLLTLMLRQVFSLLPDSRVPNQYHWENEGHIDYVPALRSSGALEALSVCSPMKSYRNKI